MKRILVTGMSKTGKTTVFQELRRRGFRAVDADAVKSSGFASVHEGEITVIGGVLDWVWSEAVMQQLLDSASDPYLFIFGYSSNQASCYPQFDQIVLLTASKEIIAERLRSRTTNTFGKQDDELSRTMILIDEIEPLLRARADLIIDTDQQLEQVVELLTGLLAA